MAEKKSKFETTARILAPFFTVLLTAGGIWLAARSGFKIAKQSDRYFELRKASNMVAALSQELKANCESVEEYAEKIKKLAEKTKSRLLISAELEIRRYILDSVVDKEYLYIIEGSILNSMFSEYSRIAETYSPVANELNLPQRSKKNYYNKKQLEELATKYRKHAASLKNILQNLENEHNKIQKELQNMD